MRMARGCLRRRRQRRDNAITRSGVVWNKPSDRVTRAIDELCEDVPTSI